MVENFESSDFSRKNFEIKIERVRKCLEVCRSMSCTSFSSGHQVDGVPDGRPTSRKILILM